MRSPRAALATLIALLYSLFLAMALTGCGGGGGGGHHTPPYASALVDIFWAQRSRGDTVQGPSAALSAVITIVGSNLDGSNVNFLAPRPSGAQSQTYPYRSPQTRTGTWPLTVTFYANGDGTGPVVGVAKSQINIPGDGTTTTTISTSGTIQSLVIAPNQVIPAQQDSDITYTAYDANGNIIAIAPNTLSPGSGFYTVVSGNNTVLKVDTNGQLYGVNPGTASVTVSVKNSTTQTITSAAQTVTVGANVSVTPLAPVVAAGKNQSFTAKVTGYSNTAVTWGVQETGGGTISGSGNTIIYTAPSTPGTYHLIATTVATPHVSATATITVTQVVIYIADTGNGRIVNMTDIGGHNFSTLSQQGTQNTELGAPTSVAIGPTDGGIYIGDPGDHKIVRSDDMVGNNWTIYTGSQLPLSPRSVCVTANGQIYFADQNNNRIGRIDDISGKNPVFAGIQGSGVGEFNHPTGIWVTPDGHIFVADQGNNRIVEMSDMQGDGWTTFGSTGNGVNQLNGPASVMVGSDGKIYIADQNNSRIVRIDDMNGTNWIALGTNGSARKQFSAPADVFYGPDGNIYVADEDNNRIVQITDMNGDGWQIYQSGSSYSGLKMPTGIFVQ